MVKKPIGLKILFHIARNMFDVPVKFFWYYIFLVQQCFDLHRNDWFSMLRMLFLNVVDVVFECYEILLHVARNMIWCSGGIFWYNIFFECCSASIGGLQCFDLTGIVRLIFYMR
jgi:hypothetical protein